MVSGRDPVRRDMLLVSGLCVAGVGVMLICSAVFAPLYFMKRGPMLFGAVLYLSVGTNLLLFVRLRSMELHSKRSVTPRSRHGDTGQGRSAGLISRATPFGIAVGVLLADLWFCLRVCTEAWSWMLHAAFFTSVVIVLRHRSADAIGMQIAWMAIAWPVLWADSLPL